MTTATDKLRNLLDERGVEWKEGSPNKTKWSHDGIEFVAVNAWPRNGGKTRLILCANITPEQAIEATLGREDTYTRDDVESAFVSGYSLGCLPVGSDPRWDQNEQTVDEHMAELGWVRAATLGSGTCKVESSIAIEFSTHISPDYYEFEMSCGSRFRWSDNEPPDYCPGCGRKVVHDGS